MIRCCDFLLALLLLVCLSPLLILCSLAVLFGSGWPILYREIRSGRHGKAYRHYKYRTMKTGPAVGRVFFEQQRLTRAGRLLRALHLDELPELCLILRGRLSFVGPRPLPPKLLKGLDCSMREQVRPGWTGPAQIMLLRRGRLDKRLQIRLDNHYVRQQSLKYNLRLLVATGAAMLHPAPVNMDPKASAERRNFLSKK